MFLKEKIAFHFIQRRREGKKANHLKQAFMFFYQIQLVFFIETICKPLGGALYFAAFSSAETSEVNTKNTEELTHKQSQMLEWRS